MTKQKQVKEGLTALKKALDNGLKFKKDANGNIVFADRKAAKKVFIK